MSDTRNDTGNIGNTGTHGKRQDQQHSDVSRNQPDRPKEIDWDTADEILTREFVIDNPNRIDGLLDIVPNDVDRVDIIYVYNCKDADIRCSFCRQHQRHFKGYVVRLPNGKMARLGHHCGKHHFPETFEEICNKFERQRQLKYYTILIQPIDRAITESTPILADWRNHLRVVRDYRYDFRNRFSILFEHLTTTVRRDGGVLAFTKRERDFAAEERRDQRVGPHSKEYGKKIWTARYYNLGPVAGQEFLDLDAWSEFREAQAQLQSARERLSNLGMRSSLTDKKVIAIDVKEARSALQRTVLIYESYRSFATEENFKRIARWARAVLEENFAVNRRRLIWKKGSGRDEWVILEPLPDQPPLDVSVIDLLNVKLNQ